MESPNIESLVNQVIARFVENMLGLARAELERQLRSFVPPGGRGAEGAGPLASVAEVASVAVVEGPSRPRIVARPAAPVRVVHAAEHVERLVELVKAHPWPPESHELQILLGVKKDPFLRIVRLALATGRIRRTGQKSGVKYFWVR